MEPYPGLMHQIVVSILVNPEMETMCVARGRFVKARLIGMPVAMMQLVLPLPTALLRHAGLIQTKICGLVHNLNMSPPSPHNWDRVPTRSAHSDTTVGSKSSGSR